MMQQRSSMPWLRPDATKLKTFAKKYIYINKHHFKIHMHTHTHTHTHTKCLFHIPHHYHQSGELSIGIETLFEK